MLRAIPRLQQKYGFDLNPATKDEPVKVADVKNRFNPFENGSLMLLIIVCLFVGFAVYHISSAKGSSRRRTRAAYLFLLPIFLLLGIFNYFPALSGLYHAFTDWDGQCKAVFIGFDNFRKLADDIVFFKGVWNMTILVLAGLFKMVVIPFIAAEFILLLSNDKLKYFFRTAFLVPMVVPGMVILMIWRLIYDPNVGMLNQALTSIGLEKLTASWLGDPQLALLSIVFMGFPWIGAFALLIYMAGLMHIPSSVLEAYQLESRSLIKRIFTIDIPLVKGQTRMLMILTFIGTIQEFQTILIMTSGGPGISTYVPALRMYMEAFEYNHFGYGAAIGLVLFLVILLITFINMKVVKAEEF
jgi:raffinose/stachyose/melibiose transport system permease protein